MKGILKGIFKNNLAAILSFLVLFSFIGITYVLASGEITILTPANTTVYGVKGSTDLIYNDFYFNVSTSVQMKDCYASVDGGTFAAMTNSSTTNVSWYILNTSMNDAAHNVDYYCNDSSDNRYDVGLTNFTFSSDLPMTITLITPAVNNSYRNDVSQLFNLTTNESARSVWVMFNSSSTKWPLLNASSANTSWYLNTTNYTSSSPFRDGNIITALIQGNITNNLANAATTRLATNKTFTIDTTKPWVGSVGRTNTIAGEITLTFNVSDTNFDYCFAKIYPISNTSESTWNVNGTRNSTTQICTVNVTPFTTLNSSSFIEGEIYVEPNGVDSALNLNNSIGNETNLVYNYLYSGWNLLGVVEGAQYKAWNFSHLLSNIDYVSWFNATNKTFQTFTKLSGNSSSNNATALDSQNAVFVSVTSDSGFFRNISSSGVRNITVPSVGWATAGQYNNSQIIYEKMIFDMTGGKILDNNTLAIEQYSVKYFSYYTPQNTSYPYRSYRLGYNMTEAIQNILIPRGRGFWFSLNTTSAPSGDTEFKWVTSA